MSPLRPLWLLPLVAACVVPPSYPPADANLVTSGLGGLTLGGEGHWVRETLHWTDGSNPDEVHHHFLLGYADDVCAAWDSTTTSAPTTTDPVAACEQTRDQYAAFIGQFPPGSLRMEFDLWDTELSDDHIAIAPEPGDYVPLGTEGGGRVQFAFYGVTYLSDWYADVVENLDCAAKEPWANVPRQDLSFADFDAAGGTLTLGEPDGDVLPFSLAALNVQPDAFQDVEFEGGVLDGVGVFHACDAVREMEPSGPIID